MTTPDPLAEAYTFFGFMAFVFGTLFGSFFNVCIYRVPIQRSIVQPPSHCYSCGTHLKWYDNIPLLSYLLLRGNCRFCGSHFSARYFFVELLTGLMFLGIYLKFGLDWALPFHLAFVSLLLVGTFTDIDHYILPDGITIGGLIFALGASLILRNHSIVASEYLLARDLWYSFGSLLPSRAVELPWYSAFLFSVVSAVFGYAMLWGIGFAGSIMFRKDAMGGGDIKLFAFLGAYLGSLNCIWILFLSAILGSCIGGTLLLVHHFLRKDEYEDLELHAEGIGDSQTGTVNCPSEVDDSDREEDPGNAVALDDGNVSSASEPVTAQTAEGQQTSVRLRIARKTSRQLHHFPFGPYIAVAALIVLVYHKEVNTVMREFLMLPPAPALKLSQPEDYLRNYLIQDVEYQRIERQ